MGKNSSPSVCCYFLQIRGPPAFAYKRENSVRKAKMFPSKVHWAIKLSKICKLSRSARTSWNTFVCFVCQCTRSSKIHTAKYVRVCSEHFLCARFSISSTGARIPIQKGKSPNILRSRTSWRTYLGQRGRVFFSAMCILLCPIPIGQFSTVPGWSSSCESNKTILCDSIISSLDGGTTALPSLRHSHQALLWM